ncbi:hypothetical protein HBB16_16550 [Pseudonocardia sp. MCCB 268]|nr:hypothetical protein [Pseudonocardia cytotoxica]
MISYRNPDSALSDVTMSDYLREGPLARWRSSGRDHRPGQGQRRQGCAWVVPCRRDGRLARGEGHPARQLADADERPAGLHRARAAGCSPTRRPSTAPKRSMPQGRLPPGVEHRRPPSTCSAPPTWCGTTWSTTGCSTRTRSRSTC